MTNPCPTQVIATLTDSKKQVRKVNHMMKLKTRNKEAEAQLRLERAYPNEQVTIIRMGCE